MTGVCYQIAKILQLTGAHTNIYAAQAVSGHIVQITPVSSRLQIDMGVINFKFVKFVNQNSSAERIYVTGSGLLSYLQL